MGCHRKLAERTTAASSWSRRGTNRGPAPSAVRTTAALRRVRTGAAAPVGGRRGRSRTAALRDHQGRVA